MFEVFAVKTKLIHELLKDEKWKRKLEKAETTREVEAVLVEFAREKRLKVKEVKV